MTMKSINLARKHHQILQEEFSGKASRQTISTALKYFNNSELAHEIRKRALELLAKEIQDNK